MANLNSNPIQVVSCPYCGKKYAPSEIFIPKAFLGTANMVDDENYFGNAMDLSDTYTCDKCNNLFEVKASISFNCERAILKSFEENF